MINFLRDLSKKAQVWLVGVICFAIIAVPTAIWFGTADAIFESPKQGISAFFGVVSFAVVWLGLEYVAELIKDKRRDRRDRPGSGQGRS
ncbi:MAG: hypothetical protein ACTH1Z_01715 [Ancrocorticia sp.]|uniref:hypothetical protein n=1 Tax=Ancrocorticia sp. TaxID=2593684 RepID=UPI003F9001EE